MDVHSSVVNPLIRWASLLEVAAECFGTRGRFSFGFKLGDDIALLASLIPKLTVFVDTENCFGYVCGWANACMFSRSSLWKVLTFSLFMRDLITTRF